jgi:sugar (pentulose or hexulose) kinase
VGTSSETILSLDLGTTAIKVGLFAASGELLHLAAREQKLHFPEEDRVEQDLSHTWKLVCEATGKIFSNHDPGKVSAIVVSVQRGSVVPIDKDLEPLSKLIVWMDPRGLQQVDRLHQLIGNDKYYQTSGHPIVPITGVSKVLWLHKQAPELWDKTAIVGAPQTVFLRWLGCDEALIDHSTASYLFPNDIREKNWSAEIGESLGFPIERLPRIVGATDIVGELSKQAGKDLGLPTGIPIVAGGGDGQLAAAGTGVVVPGNVMVNLGTATGVQVYLTEPTFDPSQTLNCASHVVPGAWEMEGHTQASGTVFRWFRDEFGATERQKAEQENLDAYNLLIDQAKQAPPGSDDLIFLPTFNGSTAPIVDSHARGAFIGLKLAHTRSHIIRAMLEGISLEIRWMLDTIAATGVPVDEIRLAGGGSKNPAWNQIHADILGRPIYTIKNPDAAMVGAAICAAVALGHYPDFGSAAEAFVQLGSKFEPLSETAGVYERTYARYTRTFELLSENQAFGSVNDSSGGA